MSTTTSSLQHRHEHEHEHEHEQPPAQTRARARARPPPHEREPAGAGRGGRKGSRAFGAMYAKNGLPCCAATCAALRRWRAEVPRVSTQSTLRGAAALAGGRRREARGGAEPHRVAHAARSLPRAA
jgi:hypothetical protein